MMTSMSDRPTSESKPDRVQSRIARNSGWNRSDIVWERWQEEANRLLRRGRPLAAAVRFVAADFVAVLRFDDRDPRRIASTANLGFALRLIGLRWPARRFYRIASAGWTGVPDILGDIEIKPRARSSLFHLRLEAKHRAAFRENRIARLRAIVEECGECLECLLEERPVPHRLYDRWLGEKPPIYDDARKLLSACLLIASR